MNDSSLSNFIDFLKKNKSQKVLIYVYADWCDKCKFDRNKLKNVLIYSINIDKSGDLVDILDIRILPYFMYISYDIKQNDINVIETFDTIEQVYSYTF